MMVESDVIQEVAERMMGEFGCSEGITLLYAEVEEGAVSADLFFQASAASSVKFRFAPSELSDLVYSIWESGLERVEAKSWVTLQLLIVGGEFNLEFQYPDQIDPDESQVERRPRVIANCFPGAVVDYSIPKACAS